MVQIHRTRWPRLFRTSNYRRECSSRCIRSGRSQCLRLRNIASEELVTPRVSRPIEAGLSCEERIDEGRVVRCGRIVRRKAWIGVGVVPSVTEPVQFALDSFATDEASHAPSALNARFNLIPVDCSQATTYATSAALICNRAVCPQDY